MDADKRNNRLDGYGRYLLKQSCKSLQQRSAAGVAVGKICAFTTAACHPDAEQISKDWITSILSRVSTTGEALKTDRYREQLQKQRVSLSENNRQGSPR